MAAANSVATLSSLELMLDKLRQLEEDQPRDGPPALPIRPISRARPPRARRPLRIELQKRNSDEQNDASFKCGGSESIRIKKEDNEESDGVAAQFDQLQKRIELSENRKQIPEKGISNIQKCYRAHQVRCYYKELRRGTIAIQSFIRGENARKGYHHRRRSLSAIIIIQKQTRKYLEQRVLRKQQAALLHSGIQNCWNRTRSTEIVQKPIPKGCDRVQYRVLIDLQKRVLRTEAKVREKKKENIALKTKLTEMETKWRQYEERMKSMEKAWQDQLRYIQKCLGEAKGSGAPEIRLGQSDYDKKHYTNQNHDTVNAISGITNGRNLEFPINSSNQRGQAYSEDDDNLTDDCPEEGRRPDEELGKLKLRFKAWKKEYKSKLRDARSTFRKIGNSEAAKCQKNWWGRLSN